MERCGGQYLVTNCRNVGAMLGVCAMFPPLIFQDRYVDLRRSRVDVSTFEDRCVDLRRWMIDVPTFEYRWSLCRPSKTNDRCEMMLLHLLKTLMVQLYANCAEVLHFSAFIFISPLSLTIFSFCCHLNFQSKNHQITNKYQNASR